MRISGKACCLGSRLSDAPPSVTAANVPNHRVNGVGSALDADLRQQGNRAAQFVYPSILPILGTSQQVPTFRKRHSLTVFLDHGTTNTAFALNTSASSFANPTAAGRFSRQRLHGVSGAVALRDRHVGQ